ncbi:MAG: ABC transporter substrate-binding protein [Chloracidobacterium sp.]|nr:ABC transporter substrate-binding protein [Chloracidobacterium sp.]MDW8216030.1 ABC transporter substrate-binding protein [Acidobacteriota bacterium]
MMRLSANVGLMALALALSALAGKYGFAWQQKATSAAQRPKQPALESKPSRIISTEYNVNEMLVDLVEPERILALSQDADNPGLCNILERTARIPGRVASTPIRAEQILALDPDVVFVGASCPAETVRLLELSRARVVRINRGYTIAEIQENIRLVGDTVGEPARAQALIDEMNRQLAAVRAKVAGAPPPRALYIGSGYGYTAGIGTYTDELLQAAGARNAAREAGVEAWGKITLETVIEMDPDVIFVPDTGGRAHGAVGRRYVVPPKPLEKDPLWQDVRAVKTGRVVTLPPRLLMCNSHYNVRAAWAMARALHPDRFEDKTHDAP